MYKSCFLSLIFLISLTSFGQNCKLCVVSSDPATSVSVIINNVGSKLELDQSGCSVFSFGQFDTLTIQIQSNSYSDTIMQFFRIEDVPTELFVNLENLTYELHTVDVSFLRTRRAIDGVLDLSKRDYNLLPGTFDDPTRLLVKYPSMSGVNDQSNAFSFMGLPTHYNSWSYNGVLIVNPNHLSNAGTVTDIRSASAGGVNSLSGQAFQGAKFLPSHAIASGHSIGGVVDFYSDSVTPYFQASLLGLEGGYRVGPVSASYRYSFTGLLGLMGVDFGGESIGFQDLNIRYMDTLHGTWKIKASATLGNSFNNFKPTGEKILQKDFQTIDYESKIGIFVVNASNGQWNHKLGYSTRRDYRTANGIIPFKYGETNSFIQDTSDLILDRWNYQLNKSLTNTLNLYAEIGTDHMVDAIALDSLRRSQDRFMPWLAMGIQKSGDIGKLEWNATVKPLYNFLANAFSPNFNLRLMSELSNNVKFVLQGGHTSVVPDSWIVLWSDQDIQLTKAFHIDAAYLQEESDYLFSVNAGYKWIYDVPVTFDGFSSFNELGYPLSTGFSEIETALTSGIALTFEKQLGHGLYLSTNASIFNSQYKFIGVSFAPSQSTNYALNAIIGKSWLTAKNRKWSIGVSYSTRGGNKSFPTNSLLAFDTTYDYINGPSILAKAYSRVDFRISLTKGKATLSLDIQNLTNHINEGYSYFDRHTKKIETTSQLGLLPVLAYRWLF